MEVDESGDKDKMAMFADKIKALVNSPAGYEMACLLTVGYPAEGAFLPRQKEIEIESRIHSGKF